MLDDPKQMEALKKWLREFLHEEIIALTFEKKDGTMRTMKCTLKDTIVPKVEVKEKTTPRKVNDDVQSVWDVEANAWRSFRWDSLKTIEFSLGEDI
jgi:WYL_2, Sm-like SH3 beta-barrel fold